MLEIKVKKRLGSFTVDVAFSTGEAGVTALFGRSGAGKTSVINMVAGLFPPDEGLIEVNGLKLFDSEHSVDLPPEKRRCGYVFQDGRLFPHLTVKANLIYGMKLVPRTERYVSYDQVVELLGDRPSPGPQTGEAFRWRKTKSCNWPGSVNKPQPTAHGRTPRFFGQRPQGRGIALHRSTSS